MYTEKPHSIQGLVDFMKLFATATVERAQENVCKRARLWLEALAVMFITYFIGIQINLKCRYWQCKTTYSRKYIVVPFKFISCKFLVRANELQKEKCSLHFCRHQYTQKLIYVHHTCPMLLENNIIFCHQRNKLCSHG